MQFLLLGYDSTDTEALNRRLAVRSAHLESSNKLRSEGKLLYAAAILSESSKMIGSMMIFDFENQSALEEWLKTEPYVTGKVWEKTEIKPCQVAPSFLI